MSEAQVRRKSFADYGRTGLVRPFPYGKSGTRSPSGFRSRRGRSFALIVAFFVGTGDDRPSLQVFFDQEGIAAARALLVDRLVGRSKFALRIVRAAVERVALARLLLDKITVFAVRAL